MISICFEQLYEMVSNGPETSYHLSASFDKTILPGIHRATALPSAAPQKPSAWLELITPVVDVTLRNEESHKLSPRDPSLDIVGLASPLLGEVDELPPMMVLTAENDLLGPDTRLFVDKARAAGREVTHVEGKGMMHVWQLQLPHHDSKEAIDRMVHSVERGLQ
ncbi:hypothetical protein E4U59_000497 [Claviceps monticola]|nr:hypothetical protein E4U59_000497 [Claviceps monticola]